MQQLMCPHCGQPISSENINIQQMAAVCSACHSVFQFQVADPKIKRRKVKQPQQITSYETDDHLNITFRTHFRLAQNETFLATAGFSAIFTFITLILANAVSTKPEAGLILLGFGLFTLFLYYCLALIAFNKTHIEISDENIKVSRKPLPNPLSELHTIELANVALIRYEETAVSKKEAYDLPRYNVWADKVDGNRQILVSDVVEDYAVFISQRLNEFLELENVPDTSRLIDDAETAEDTIIEDGFTMAAKGRR